MLGFLATSFVVGAATGALSQSLSNLAGGQPWDQHLGQAALAGGIAGLIGGGLAAGAGIALDGLFGDGAALAADGADGFGGCGACCGGAELSFAASARSAAWRSGTRCWPITRRHGKASRSQSSTSGATPTTTWSMCT